ncbi:MAG: serine/threonine protein kinase [Lentisphaeria bacterium]|nr:serine/threonine protein kinase [Lentisphaeria bacterium]
MGSAEMKPAVGAVLDGYKLLAEVGSGSCGRVFQAENLLSGEIFALKLFPEQGDLAERELQAVRLYQKIEHPNLIRIHHVGRTGEMLFYTMDWCESSLAGRKVSPEELLDIARKLTSALAALHENGLIHRDIKPDNIFFRNGEIVLGDIGLVTRSETATFAGSPGYLAPALLNGKTAPNEYTDCYALAKSLYCALSGQEPGKFPYYDGELSEAASTTLRAVLAVCSDEPELHNAAELLSFLEGRTTLQAPRRRNRKYLSAAVLSAAVLLAIAFLIRHYAAPVPVPEVPPKTVPAVQTAETRAQQKPPAKPAVPDFPKVRRSYSTLSPEEYNRRMKTGTLHEYGSDTDRLGDWFNYLDWLKQHQADRAYRESYAAYSASIKDPAKQEESRKIHAALCDSGVGADTLSLDRDPDRMERWQRAGVEWERSRKWKCLEELLRREKESGRSPAEILRQMAEQDPYVKFFGLEQADWIALRNQARQIRNQKDKTLQDKYRKATEKYLACREAFLRSLSPE